MLVAGGADGGARPASSCDPVTPSRIARIAPGSSTVAMSRKPDSPSAPASLAYGPIVTGPTGALNVIRLVTVIVSVYAPVTMLTMPPAGTAATPSATVSNGL